MIEMYVAAGIVVYVLIAAVAAWGVGRFTSQDGNEPPVALGIAFWPVVLIMAPFVGLVFSGMFAFKWGRRRRDIEARRQEYLEQTARETERELARKESSTPGYQYR